MRTFKSNLVVDRLMLYVLNKRFEMIIDPVEFYSERVAKQTISRVYLHPLVKYLTLFIQPDGSFSDRPIGIPVRLGFLTSGEFVVNQTISVITTSRSSVCFIDIERADDESPEVKVARDAFKEKLVAYYKREDEKKATPGYFLFSGELDIRKHHLAHVPGVRQRWPGKQRLKV